MYVYDPELAQERVSLSDFTHTKEVQFVWSLTSLRDVPSLCLSVHLCFSVDGHSPDSLDVLISIKDRPY